MVNQYQRDADEAASIQEKYEAHLTEKALRKVANENPGAVVWCGTDMRLNLSEDDSTHLDLLQVDGSILRRKRLRVWYHQIGSEMDFEAEHGDKAWFGDTPEHEKEMVGCKVEYFRKDALTEADELVARIEKHICDRWVPDYNKREYIETDWDVLEDE